MLNGTGWCRNVNTSGAREANWLHIHLHRAWGSRCYLLWQERDLALTCLPPPHPVQISFLVINTSNGGHIGRGGGTTMAPHSSALAWKIPWTEEPGGLQSMGSLGDRHDWATSLSLFSFMRWRRKWQPTPVFLPGESQGWGSLVGCHLWGRTELDMTEVT